MNEQIIFEPYNLNGLALSNRIVMAPMTRSRSANPGNVPTELTARYYQQRASAGLIITEGTYVSREAVGYVNVPGIYTEQQVEGWKLVTDAVHERGSKIFAQLWHVGRISHPDLLNGELPLAPSALNPLTKVFTPEGLKDTVDAREMTTAQIQKTINDFKQAAANAVEAGFDGVELHAANGYLLHQFFNLYSNKRQDQYGGTIKNRARILFDILDELRTVIDITRVGVRLNPSLHGIQGMMLDEETIAVHDYIVAKLNEYSLAYLHLTEPFTDVSGNPWGIEEVAKRYRPLYDGTIIINRGFNKTTASQVLNDSDADLVSFGVPFIANPDLVERFKADAPLNQPDQSTFYTPGEKGYTDYPVMAEQ
ncbi:alkene reductase [Mucilaginibacter gossypii]|uniref:alkene reductase n=1 Tax=Mucilaginibacter gossypii TaxID=551996 RepID=UPI000DCEA300|nr:MULTISPECIES: alkene reductase [Mucilaginibacter]QTE39796.1 alkene reductase [Mucilaginibacter gossypii]RAV54236.1 alkene reductase [Mucilaginibacter rubeus]